jgi:UDP-N-acetylmuramoylalanine--D-glutamate ligase
MGKEMNLINKQVLVIGLGVSGRAAADFLLKSGAKVAAVDRSKELLETHEQVIQLRHQGMSVYLETDPLELDSYDFVVVSPGIPPTHPVHQKALKEGKEVIGEVELACRSIAQPFLAITGSNGKTTTTLLVEHVLKTSGYKAKALGNIGIPLTQALMDSPDAKEILVVELSSWQLETLKSQVIDAAVILNITPNHLDRHLSMQAYAAAKIGIKNCLKPGKNLWMGSEYYREFLPLIQSHPVMTFGYSADCDIFCDKQNVIVKDEVEFTLPQEYRAFISHDVENMMAAFALCKEVGIEAKQFMTAFASFKKPPHRIEFVRKLNGVSYYDDSKGTNLEAVIKAVQSMKGTTILIAGGVHKGTAYTPWIKAFAGKVRCICAIGQAAEQIKSELGLQMHVNVFADLNEAILYAAAHAKFGENVLLSPGCASYDMFKDYQHRGQEFKRLINDL